MEYKKRLGEKVEEKGPLSRNSKNYEGNIKSMKMERFWSKRSV